jgi:hypothetical protein
MNVRLASLLALSSVVYITGALGLEMIGGRYLEVSGQAALDRSPAYVVLTTAEETLEMIGLVLCTYALLVLLQERGGVTLSLEAGRATQRETSHPNEARSTTHPPRRHALAWRRWWSVRPAGQPSEGSSKIT